MKYQISFDHAGTFSTHIWAVQGNHGNQGRDGAGDRGKPGDTPRVIVVPSEPMPRVPTIIAFNNKS